MQLQGRFINKNGVEFSVTFGRADLTPSVRSASIPNLAVQPSRFESTEPEPDLDSDPDSPFRIFRGRLSHFTQVPNDENVSIICKLTQTASGVTALRTEANYYSKELVKLQGSVVPNFLGYYEDEARACILLQDCGDRISSEDFQPHWNPKEGDHRKAVKEKVMDCMLRLHREAGIMLNQSFLPYAVVRDKAGEVRIVGFSGAIGGHECKGVLKLYALYYGVHDWECVGCEELFVYAAASKYLTPGWMMASETPQYFPFDRFTDTASMLKAARPAREEERTKEDYERIKNSIEDMVRRYREEYGYRRDAVALKNWPPMVSTVDEGIDVVWAQTGLDSEESDELDESDSGEETSARADA